MRILVNYHPSEKDNLVQLGHYLRQAGLQGLSTSATLSPGELVDKAKRAACQGIFLVNEDTLHSCVTGTKPTLDKHRGSRLNLSVPTIVGNRLDHINTVPYGPWLLEQDLKKFKTLSVPNTPFNFKTLTDIADFDEAYNTCASSLLLAYDIETSLFNEDAENCQAGESVITSASWACLLPDWTIQVYVLPFIDFGTDHWESDFAYQLAIDLMRRINALQVPKVMQNGTYDTTHSIRYHAEPQNWVLDTLGIAHSTYSELPKDLAFLASYHCYDYIYWKDDSEEASKAKDINKFWRYNGLDAWYTLRIVLSQLKTAPAYAWKNYIEQFKLVYPFTYCAFEGFKIDQDQLATQRKDAVVRLETARTELQAMFADTEFNPGSWQQIEFYIYDIFGARKPKIGKSKSCTDEKNLKAVAQQHPLLARLTDSILQYKKAQKEISNYYDFLQLNNRLYYSLDPFGTETSRAASSASDFWCGTQIQNIPGYAKTFLIADEGYELVEIDNNKSEARCTAYLSQDEVMIEALEDTLRDFYRTLGPLFFNMTYEEVDDFFRNKVLKKIVHGTNYMMGAKTFVETIGVLILIEAAGRLGIKLVQIPRANHLDEKTIAGFAKELLEKYHVPFNKVRPWYKEVYNEILLTGRLVSPLGNVRQFFGDIKRNYDILKAGVAHGPQNLSVTILNRGLWKIYKQQVLPSHGTVRLKAQVHDSVLAQYKKELRDLVVPEAQRNLNNPVIIHGRTLTIPTEAEISSTSWKAKKAYHVPT